MPKSITIIHYLCEFVPCISNIPFHYSMRFRDSTISNFLILRENIRFTTIDNVNVIAAVNKTFVIVNEGIM